MSEQEKQFSDFGAMTGVIIVIIVLLVGAFYFVGQRIEQSKKFQASINQEMVSTTSDEIADIESDANAIDLNSLGEGIDQL